MLYWIALPQKKREYCKSREADYVSVFSHMLHAHQTNRLQAVVSLRIGRFACVPHLYYRTEHITSYGQQFHFHYDFITLVYEMCICYRKRATRTNANNAHMRFVLWGSMHLTSNKYTFMGRTQPAMRRFPHRTGLFKLRAHPRRAWAKAQQTHPTVVNILYRSMDMDGVRVHVLRMWACRTATTSSDHSKVQLSGTLDSK